MTPEEMYFGAAAEIAKWSTASPPQGALLINTDGNVVAAGWHVAEAPMAWLPGPMTAAEYVYLTMPKADMPTLYLCYAPDDKSQFALFRLYGIPVRWPGGGYDPAEELTHGN